MLTFLVQSHHFVLEVGLFYELFNGNGIRLAFDNKDRLKKIARAFILRFASEIMLDSQFKHASFNAWDFVSIVSKVMSCMKSSN